MNHAGDGLLQAYIDGEVTGEEKSALVAHLDACAECGQELESLRAAGSVFRSAMSLYSDSPAVAVAREQVLRAHKTVPAEVETIDLSSRRRPVAQMAASSFARAAAVILLVATGAAAVIPGSPLRRWIASGYDRITGTGVERSAPKSVTPSTSVAAERVFVPGAETSIAAVDGQVTVQVWDAAGAGRVVVRIVDIGRTTVQIDTSAHSAEFRSAKGRLEVLRLGAADAEIGLPRSLRRATVEVNGKPFLVKEGDQLRVTGPVVRQTADEIVFKTGS